MATLRESNLAQVGGCATVPPIISSDLCEQCGQHPRLGALRRCKRCLTAAADADRQARAEAEARVKAKAEAQQAATKRCKCCGAVKPLSSFAPHKRSRDGHRHACKPCVRRGLAVSKPMSAERTARKRAAAADPARRAKMRAAVADWRRRNPSAGRARLALHRALKKGKVQRPQICQVAGCEATRLVGHHADYGKPLEVLHVCGSHHRQLHSGVALKLKPGVPARLKRIPRMAA
jgi:hypothetical protein